MTLSPEQWAEVRERAAEMIREAALEEAGGISGFIVLPLATVTQMTGLSRHTIPQKMPVTEAADGKHGVTLKNLTAYIDGKTVEPGSRSKKVRGAGAGTPTPRNK